MNTAEIQCVMQRALHGNKRGIRFAGVFAANTAPKRINEYPTCFVINTEPASMDGEHWVACYASEYDSV